MHLTCAAAIRNVAVVPSEIITDEALARRIAEGAPGTTDAEEAELYKRFAPRVRFYGRRHLTNAAADDLAQTVMLLVFERLRRGEVRDLSAIGSFILGTCRMTAQSDRRVGSRRDALRVRYMDASATVDTPSLDRLDAPRLAGCLNKLAERDRQVVLLTYYADREAPEIAADLGCSAGAVRVMRHRAIEHLRDCVTGGVHAH
jgi:RNA polymerase sigma-70 factor (ECF subfamily)